MANLKRKANDDHVELPTSKRINKEQNVHEISSNDCVDGHHSLKIGSLFYNRYCVEKQLGSGGSATVWQCWDSQNKCDVAIKIVNSENCHTEAALHEINILECVKPKRIIKKYRQKDINNKEWKKINQLIDHFKISCIECTHICLVLEIMDGSLIDLCESPNGWQIISNNTKNIIKQILQGLDYLHRNCKIIHTDLKPDNILYRLDGSNDSDEKITVEIADLGSACYVHHPFSIGLQTHRFRSHEFLLNAPCGPSADIWSMACLIFFLVTSDHLFDSQSGEDYSEDEDHLAISIALLGKMPKHVVLSGKLSSYFFNDEGELRHKSKRQTQSLYDLLTVKYKWDENEAEKFVDFLLPMLNFDPKKRPSARRCLKHRWFVDVAQNLTPVINSLVEISDLEFAEKNVFNLKFYNCTG